MKNLSGNTYTVENVYPDESINDFKLKLSEILEEPTFHTVNIRLILARMTLDKFIFLKNREESRNVSKSTKKSLQRKREN